MTVRTYNYYGNTFRLPYKGLMFEVIKRPSKDKMLTEPCYIAYIVNGRLKDYTINSADYPENQYLARIVGADFDGTKELFLNILSEVVDFDNEDHKELYLKYLGYL